MTSLAKRFIKDKNGNKVWAKAHLSSVYDDNGTPLSTIIGELGTAANKNFTSSIDGSASLPTASAVQSYVGTIVSYPLEASIGGVITDITVIL